MLGCAVVCHRALCIVALCCCVCMWYGRLSSFCCVLRCFVSCDVVTWCTVMLGYMRTCVVLCCGVLLCSVSAVVCVVRWYYVAVWVCCIVF